MAFTPDFASRLRNRFGTAFAVKDANGVLGQKFNNVRAASEFARRISLRHDGLTFSVWRGRGFTVSVGIKFRDGRRR